MRYQDPFGAEKSLTTSTGTFSYFDINALEQKGHGSVSRLPYSIKILLESVLRNVNGQEVSEDDVHALLQWGKTDEEINVPLKVARVILQDFTGVPAVVDLAAMRSAMDRFGADPTKINPDIPVDLVIDHSVQVDHFGSQDALNRNVTREYERNAERYTLLKWAQGSLDNFRAVPPGNGIIHQVNLEYLAPGVGQRKTDDNKNYVFPDSVLGTDSHTTMIDALGVLGWGVGGIEAEAVLLGQPYYMLAPKVVGFKLTGELPSGATATDLVLTITETLRNHGVVGKFVEFYGPGLANLALHNRATVANMAPEYGATMGFFPIDDETLKYLRLSGRDEATVELVERYSKAVGLFADPALPAPEYSECLELDMSTIQPCLAGPKRPQDRVRLCDLPESFHGDLTKGKNDRGFGLEAGQLENKATISRDGADHELTHGSVVIAAITSCTNTSNPSVMIGAGLLAKNAVEAGLNTAPWVKTSLAPGSRVVTNYLDDSGLTPFLEELRFHTVGYGCTTCIGNSGPLADDIEQAINDQSLIVSSVISGNRNFEGRVHANVRASYLGSPLLVVAYALAGRCDIDFETQAIGTGKDGAPVFLRDIWPSEHDVQDVMMSSMNADSFAAAYGSVFDGDESWQNLKAPTGNIYEWDSSSTYVQEPPFFVDMPLEVAQTKSIKGARVLALLGDSITTDHISPAGAIPPGSPAAQYLTGNAVGSRDFNSFGSRRGNHEVMMRGTFANVRLKNQLLDGVEGGYTLKLPEQKESFLYDASMTYQSDQTPLIVLAGKEYGTGSSRDWAAKGTYLLGVQAVIAESYERIHRSNLLGMGVLPLEFMGGQNWQNLGLSGHETFDIDLDSGVEAGGTLTVTSVSDTGDCTEFQVKVRLDLDVEVDYWRNGGILQTVLRRLVQGS